MSPIGTTEAKQASTSEVERLSRPYGTESRCEAWNPAINRWAIIECPYGTTIRRTDTAASCQWHAGVASVSGPDGAEGCSHGWSSPEANGTRGTVTTQPARPGGAEDGSTANRQSIEHVTRLEVHVMNS